MAVAARRGLVHPLSSAHRLWRITGAKVTLCVSSGLLGLMEKLLAGPRDFLNPTFPGSVSGRATNEPWAGWEAGESLLLVRLCGFL